MKQFLLAMLITAAAALGAARLPVFGYTFRMKTYGDSGADPGFKKLTDGKINADNAKERYGTVKFRHNENKGIPTQITFNFKNEVKLDEARIL